MADSTDTPTPAKQNEQDPPKAKPATPRASAGATAGKQAATAKRAGNASAGATRKAADKEAAKIKGAAAADARSTRAAADTEAANVRQAAAAEARTIKETARGDVERVKRDAQNEARRSAEAEARRITDAAQREAAQTTKAAADEAARVRQAAQAQARQIRQAAQAAQAEAQAAQPTAPTAGADLPEGTSGVLSLIDLTREAWQRNMELAISVLPAYVRIYESAVETFGAAYREAGATSAHASSAPEGDDRATQSVSRLAEAGTAAARV